jgi:hypothetical protein
MLRLIPFSSPPMPAQRSPQGLQWNPQWTGIGVLMSLLLAGLGCYTLSSKPQISEAPLTIGTIAQKTSSEQQSQDCQPHEIFRVSDRRCYQMQGE